jgi:hypothetical protein
MKRWLHYLANERAYKLSRIDALASGWARLQMISDGATRDVTDEELEKLRADVAEIDHILSEEGCSFPDA